MQKLTILLFALLSILGCNKSKDNNKPEWVVTMIELRDGLSIKVQPSDSIYSVGDTIELRVDLYSKSNKLESREFQTTFSLEKPIDLDYWHVDSTRWFEIAKNHVITIPPGLKTGKHDIFINCMFNYGISRNLTHSIRIKNKSLST